jgi:hypothetical protein
MKRKFYFAISFVAGDLKRFPLDGFFGVPLSAVSTNPGMTPLNLSF